MASGEVSASGWTRTIKNVQRIAFGRSATASVVQIFFLRLVQVGVNFGTGVIVARSLAPIGRGSLTAISIWPTLLCGIATLGIPTALTFYSRRNPSASGQYLGAAIVASSAIGLLVIGLGAAFVPLALSGYDRTLVSEAQLLMLFAPQYLVWSVLRAYLEAMGEFSRSNIALLIPSSVTLATLFALRELGLLTVPSAALAYFIPGALQTVVMIVRLWPRLSIDASRLRDDFRLLFSYGLRASGTDVVNALSMQIDQAIIIAFVSPAVLGLYTIALAVSRILAVLQQSLVSVLFPKASSLKPAEATALVERIGRISNTVVGAGAIVFIFTIPQLLPLLYGPAFTESVTIARILTFEAFLAGSASIYSQSFLALGKPQIVAIVQAMWLAATAGFLVYLVPRLGLEGAAVALLSSSLLRLVLTVGAYPLVLRLSLPRLVASVADLHYVRQKLQLHKAK